LLVELIQPPQQMWQEFLSQAAKAHPDGLGIRALPRYNAAVIK
jgi:hypothetical protein